MSETMIHVSQLKKKYGEYTALQDVNFSVQKGEVIGFLGPNGAGKTTTMRILTGYIPPSSGVVEIAGLSVQDNPLEIRKKIGYLPESVPLYRDMTVSAYLHFIGQIKGLSGEETVRQISKVVSECSLKSVRNKVIDTLSKGYRQRVGLAQALIGDPEILILDEPTVGLDPSQIIEIRNLIKELGKERTVILSTHILPEVSQTCSRVVIINDGKIVASGTPEELTNQVKSAAVITLRVKGSNQGLDGVLNKISNDISKVTVNAVGKEEWEALLEVSSNEELRPAIASTIVKSKEWELLELHKKVLGLEEVFLELTTSD